MTKWDKRYLELAKHVASWSKDPSTKVGSVIVRSNNTVATMGFNGFPQRVRDTQERLGDRSTKLDLTVHAEINAMAFASESLIGCTLYVYPLSPCIRCATSIIQHGIIKVVAPRPEPDSRWYDSTMRAKDLLREAGVSVEWIDE